MPSLGEWSGLLSGVTGRISRVREWSGPGRRPVCGLFLFLAGFAGCAPRLATQGEFVYAALRGGGMQLFSIARAGGDSRRLTDDSANLFQPQVSPDGRLIAASRLLHPKELRRQPLGQGR